MSQSLPSFSDPLVQRLSQLIYRCLEDVGSTKAALYLADPAAHGFRLATHYGWPRTQTPPERIGALDPLLVLVSREKRGFAVNDPENYPELRPWGFGATNPRYYISPIYDRGNWQGVLIQRDPAKVGTVNPGHLERSVQMICEEIILALTIHRTMLVPPEPAARGEAPTQTLPPLARHDEATWVPMMEEPPPAEPDPEEPFLDEIEDYTGEHTAVREDPHWASSPEVLEPSEDVDLPVPDAGIFIPEQQTYFWEAANLLGQLVPTAAVALWLDDAVGPRPLLVHSRYPLSNDLKRQLVAQTLTQVPHVNREDLRLLTKAEWFEREPIEGEFTNLLPVLLEEEVGGNNLLMLFRLEDEPFTPVEMDRVGQVARMLGFYLQEARLHERYHQAFLSVSHRILASTEGRIPTMKAHSLNTAEYARELARKLDLSTAEVEAVSIAGILHDVGTLLLDYRILDKPKLSAEDLAKVRTHPLLASTFLKDLCFPFDVLTIIRHHHERWDGTGYPDGLEGEAIPIGSRIIHLVEAYEMMSSETPYRPAKPLPEILKEFERLAGVQFDPVLVEPFLEILQTR